MSCISAFMVAVKYRDIWPSCCGDRRFVDISSLIRGVHFCSQLGVSKILSGNVQLRGAHQGKLIKSLCSKNEDLLMFLIEIWKSTIVREIISLAMRPRSEHEVESCY